MFYFVFCSDICDSFLENFLTERDNLVIIEAHARDIAWYSQGRSKTYPGKPTDSLVRVWWKRGWMMMGLMGLQSHHTENENR